MSDRVPNDARRALRAEAMAVESLRRAIADHRVARSRADKADEALGDLPNSSSDATERLARISMLLQGSESWATEHLARFLARWMEDGDPLAVRDGPETFLAEPRPDGSAALTVLEEGEAPDLPPARVLDLAALEAGLLARCCVALGLEDDEAGYVRDLNAREPQLLEVTIVQGGSLRGFVDSVREVRRIRLGIE